MQDKQWFLFSFWSISILSQYLPAKLSRRQNTSCPLCLLPPLLQPPSPPPSSHFSYTAVRKVKVQTWRLTSPNLLLQIFSASQIHQLPIRSCLSQKVRSKKLIMKRWLYKDVCLPASLLNSFFISCWSCQLWLDLTFDILNESMFLCSLCVTLLKCWLHCAFKSSVPSLSVSVWVLALPKKSDSI